jgi:uncharacterized protein
MSVRLSLGAPGIYHLPESPLRALTGVRMDVCAFVGVAPRGPAREFDFTGHWQADKTLLSLPEQARRTVAIAVESFDEYRRLFGGFEGPGLLPYAVASFFEQGGRRAYIARIVHEYDDATKNAAGVAVGQVPGVKSKSNEGLILRARSEGSWGNGLRAALEFTSWPLMFDATHSDLTALAFEDESDAPLLGALLQLTLDDGLRVLRFVTKLEPQPRANGDIVWRATFDAVVIGTIHRAEQIEGELTIDDNDGRREQHGRLGLSSDHPRWIAKILTSESALVYPALNWIDQEMLPPDAAPNPTGWSPAFRNPLDGLPVKDRYDVITPEDFFDATWTRGNEEPGNGIHALTQLSDLASVVVPDLYSPMPLAPLENITDPISLAGPEFARCVKVEPKRDEQTKPQYDLAGLRLNPKLPAERSLIIALQQRLVDLAEGLQSFVILLDVPPGLTQRQMLQWRTAFNSTYAAAYHPWLQVARRDDSRDAIVRVPPSAAAAGIIAKQELAFGVPQGPANVLTAEVIGVDDVVAPARHDELHQQHINVYLRERDGVRLTAARTLSRDPQWRQLSVRRLISMLRRALDQQMQWAVFEPNHRALRAEIRILLNNYLRQLYRLGAFRGATEDQAFFVRCDETNNPSYITDAGRLIAEIGVAPAEPLEFILLRLARDGDGTLTMKEK